MRLVLITQHIDLLRFVLIERDLLGNMAERGGFEPPVEVLAPTTV